MASVASQLIEEVTAHVQSDSLEDAREICADGTYFLNNLRTVLEVFCHYMITCSAAALVFVCFISSWRSHVNNVAGIVYVTILECLL
jgi:hypothetical protein